MPQILRTRQSQADYASIFDFIAADSPQNAEMIIRLFDEKLEILSCNNTIGRPRSELGHQVRCWNVHRFILFYRPVDDGIILLRVLHSSMDITKQYFLSV